MLHRPPPSAGSRVFLALSLVGAACTGSISGDPRPGGNGTSGTGGTGVTTGGGHGGSNPTGGAGGGVDTRIPPPRSLCGPDVDPGRSPMRLLTRVEYVNTVRDLFGGMAPVTLDALPEDGRPPRGFANDTTARSASDLLVDKFFQAADKISTAAMSQMSTLLGGCDPASKGDACLQSFLDDFGKRAWRRPLTMIEKQNLTDAFNANKQKGFADGLTAVLQVMLMSPQFLYRYEQGLDIPGQHYLQLTHWEMASRLSYLLWGSMPDATLMEAAEKGKLGTPADILAQARRMVNDQRYMPNVVNFVSQFLELDQLADLDKDAMSLKDWSPDLRPLMQQEAEKFITSIFSKDGDGRLSTFLTAPYSFIDPKLAAFYGVQGGGADYPKTSLPAEKASGMLTNGGFLAVHGNTDDGLTSLVYRARWIKEELLCTPIPDPPPNALDENPPFTPQTTAREWSALRMAKPVCGSCHSIMDPVGYGLENYDPMGRWRDNDRGKKVDASGMLIGSDVDAPFTGAVELGKLLAKSQTVSDCMATQWFQFGTGRTPDPTRDSCSLNVLKQKFKDAGGDMRELLVQLTQTDAFLFRSKGDAQ
jgi:hypothetical protein